MSKTDIFERDLEKDETDIFEHLFMTYVTLYKGEETEIKGLDKKYPNQFKKLREEGVNSYFKIYSPNSVPLRRADGIQQLVDSGLFRFSNKKLIFYTTPDLGGFSSLSVNDITCIVELIDEDNTLLKLPDIEIMNLIIQNNNKSIAGHRNIIPGTTESTLECSWSTQYNKAHLEHLFGVKNNVWCGGQQLNGKRLKITLKQKEMNKNMCVFVEGHIQIDSYGLSLTLKCRDVYVIIAFN